MLGAADTDGIQAVHVRLESVDLIDAQGDLHAFDTGMKDTIDLRALADGDTSTLVDGAEVHEGHYSGLRLRIADSGNYLELEDGSTAPLLTDETNAFSAIDIDVGSSGTTSVALIVDLRFSLEKDAGGFYYLKPVLRAVDADEAGSLSGSVPSAAIEASSCTQGRAAGVGTAVYLFAGDVDEPLDFRRGDDGPMASAPLRASESKYVFDLPDLPAGGYTVAWTCQGDRDDPEFRDGLTFSGSKSTTISAGAAGIVDF